MESRERKLLKNTAILGLGTLCTKGIMFFMTPLFTRWLSQEEYGTFDLLYSYVLLLVPIVSLSLGEAIFRFLLSAERKADQEIIISTTALLYLISTVIFGAVIYLLGLYTSYNKLTLISFDTYLCLEMGYNYCIWSMRGLKRLNYYTIGNITFVAAMAIAVFLLVYNFSLGLTGILFGYAIGDLIAIIVMLLFSGIRFNVKAIRIQTGVKLIRYSLPMIPNSISWWIMSVFDRSLVTFTLGASFNGIYAVANKIPNLCHQFLNVFHLSWQQSAIEALNDNDRDAYYSKTLNELSCTLLTICILVLAMNYWFYVFLFSNEYYQGYYHSPILIFSIVFCVLSQFLGGIYVAQMESAKNGRTTIIGALTDIVVNLSLIRHIGLYAASISTLCAYAGLFLVRWKDIKKEIKITFNKNTYFLAVVFLYFFVIQYANNRVINIINIPLAIFVFLFFNRHIILKASKKIFSL